MFIETATATVTREKKKQVYSSILPWILDRVHCSKRTNKQLVNVHFFPFIAYIMLFQRIFFLLQLFVRKITQFKICSCSYKMLWRIRCENNVIVCLPIKIY